MTLASSSQLLSSIVLVNSSPHASMAEHSRLEPFLILARGMKGAGAAKVVVDATAAVRLPLPRHS